MIDWKKYVDKIYAVHFLNSKNNYNDFINELKRVDIYSSDIFEIFEGIPSSLINKLADQANDVSGCINSIDGLHSIYNMLFNHYFVIKKAYIKGYDKILVLEDDICFLKDINKITQILDNYIYLLEDENTPAILLGNSSSYDTNNTIYADKKYNDDIVELINKYAFGTGFNIYNRGAMKQLIDFVESGNCCIIDQYWIIYNDLLKLYVTPKHLCIQQDWVFLMINCQQDYNIYKPAINTFEKYANDNLLFINKPKEELKKSILNLLDYFDYTQEEKEYIKTLYNK